MLKICFPPAILRSLSVTTKYEFHCIFQRKIQPMGSIEGTQNLIVKLKIQTKNIFFQIQHIGIAFGS